MAFGIRALTRCLLLAATFGTSVEARQPATISGLCDNAAIAASRASGVPLDVLRAITLTETGRNRDGRMQPWPWTVNMEGVGKWFDTPADALAFVRAHHDRGSRSYDVGCFQVNYRWHGTAFASLEEMFDPKANALYAARFLNELFEEFGDWTKAAGAYHSRTPRFANRYTQRFTRLRASLPPLPKAPQTVEPERQPEPQNTFSLLQAGHVRGGLASLVPLEGGTGRRLIDIAGR